MDIDEAMTQLKADGIRNVIVQPTYVITGFESDAMKEKVLAFKNDFDSIIICDSLMVTRQDKEEVCQAMASEYHPDSDEVLLFMGHGTEHVANELYPEMDGLFKHFGYSNMHMGTVEGDFSIESFLDELKNSHPDHVHLAPFMIVAGDHATNDMSGEDDDSWKSILEKEGYSVKMYSERSWRDPGDQRYFYPPYQSRTGQTFRNPGLNTAGNRKYIQTKKLVFTTTRFAGYYQ